MAKENKDKSSLKNYAGGVGSSPLNAFGRADTTLVKGARLASYYSGGSSSTTAGEADTDLIFDPAKKVLEKEMKRKEAEAAMEKCVQMGGTWDSEKKKCSKGDKDDDSKSDTLKVEGKIDVGGDINVKDSGTTAGDTGTPEEKEEIIPEEEEEIVPEEEEEVIPEEEEEVIPEEEEEVIPEEEEVIKEVKNPTNEEKVNQEEQQKH